MGDRTTLSHGIDWTELLSLSADWYWEQDADLRFTYFTIPQLEAAGMSADPYLGKRRWDTPHHSVTAAQWAAHRALLERREPFKDFIVGRHGRAGEALFVAISGRPRFGAGGEFLGYAGVSRDVTTQLRAERAMRESEVRYRTLIERIPVPVFVQTQGIFRFANPACVRFFGAAQPDQIVGRPCVDLIHPDEHAEVVERIRRVAEQGVSLAATPRRFVRLDGSVVSTEVTLDPIDLDGEHGALVVIWDTTEHEALLERLRESEVRYRTLVDTSPDAVLLLTEGRIDFINRAGARLYGAARPADMMGTTLLERVDPGDRERVAARVRTLFEERRPVEPAVIRQRRLDGSTFLGEVVSTPFQVGGRAGALTVVRDVSDRVRADEAIRTLNADLEARVRRRTAQLEATSQELEAFSYSVSHDLRAPLRAIRGFAGLLRDRLSKGLDEASRDNLERIEEAGARMSRQIDGLMDLSRVSSAQFTPGAVDLGRLAAVVVDELRAGEPGRSLEVAIAPGLEALGDAVLLRQVMQNLLENAWKFTRQQAQPRVDVGVEVQGETKQYFVRDNGAGFDMALAENLFAPFQRLHPADEFPGTGIGLATVQRIVARHGGRVWAEGTPGRGATIRFTLGEGEEG